jgi:hypothetical protein
MRREPFDDTAVLFCVLFCSSHFGYQEQFGVMRSTLGLLVPSCKPRWFPL